MVLQQEGGSSSSNSRALHLFRPRNAEDPAGVAINEVLDRPEIVGTIVGAVVVTIYAAIRLTRASAGSTADAFTFVESTHVLSDSIRKSCFPSTRKGLLDLLKRIILFWVKLPFRLCLELVQAFCKILPRRIWNFYIEAFLVPSFRKEWGKYKFWSYRAVERPKHLRAHRRRLRCEERSEMLREQIPRPVPHDHRKCQRVCINVAGMIYETQLGTLDRFPETLLGNPEKRIQYYNPATQQYYFDRNRYSFDAILYYYQSGGRFCRPENIPSDILLEDAEFYQLSRSIIDQFRIEEGLTIQASKQEVIESTD